MIVGLDSTPLTVATGGIRRYVEQLHAALTEEYPRDQFLLLSGAGATGLARRWWLWGLPRALQQNGADLFHGTDFAVPYRRVTPAVMTLHDLSPWLFPEETSPRVRLRTPWLLKLGRADAVITPSEAIRRAAISRFGLREDRVRAIPLGVSRSFQPLERLPGREYFLAVGTMEGRKNLTAAVEAHRALASRAELVIAGRPGSAHLAQTPGVRFAGAVDEEELRCLYAGAIALLFPSHYEGFGLPVLEAMACGTPVIASNDPALTETSGGAALHVAADDVRQWTAAMESVWRQPEPWREAGLRRAALFTWQKTAQRTREVYADVLRRR